MKSTFSFTCATLAFFFVITNPFSLLFAQDTSLHDILIDGEGWQAAASGYNFTDGLACDREGNLYFTDVKGGDGIYKIGLDGKVTQVIKDYPNISGLHVGVDGRFYACQGGKFGRVLVFEKDGSSKELLTGVKPNDLIVTKNGFTYMTETPTNRIYCIPPNAKPFVADEGHVQKPNGITLSLDHSTLAVSEYGGKHVWAWQIGSDGKLTGAAPCMTMWVSPNNAKGIASGDGSTTDEKGRFYVTTELGIQVFDATGRLAGIIAKPGGVKSVVSVEFGGEGQRWLFVAGGGTVYKRKTNTRTAWW
jgi:enterochelin esterase family protein